MIRVDSCASDRKEAMASISKAKTRRRKVGHNEYGPEVKIQCLKWYYGGNSLLTITKKLFPRKFNNPPVERTISLCCVKFTECGCCHNRHKLRVRSETGANRDQQEVEEAKALEAAVQYIKWYYSGQTVQNIVHLHMQHFADRPVPSIRTIKWWILFFEMNGCINQQHDNKCINEADVDNVPDKFVDFNSMTSLLEKVPPPVAVPIKNEFPQFEGFLMNPIDPQHNTQL